MIRFVVLVMSCLLLAACSDAEVSASAGGIERVEPPFWWQGFKNKELQLLVRGDDIGAMSADVDYAGVKVTRVERGDSPNYLFVYLDVNASADAGTFDIILSDGDRSISHNYELRSKNPNRAHATGFSAADSIYLITPDRFVNGDPDNDSVDGYEDEPDRDEEYGRHGGDIAGMLQSLDYIKDMGFTTIWINPVLENAMPQWSYHGYATTDFYKVDPRFGSNESYRELVAAARQKGIGTIMDMIVNHGGSNHWWADDLPTVDWYNVADERTKTSHFRTTNQDPYAS